MLSTFFENHKKNHSQKIENLKIRFALSRVDHSHYTPCLCLLKSSRRQKQIKSGSLGPFKIELKMQLTLGNHFPSPRILTARELLCQLTKIFAKEVLRGNA